MWYGGAGRRTMVVGIDVGGTFTDLCAWDGRELRRAKVPTTPDDFARGVGAGLAELGLGNGFTVVAGSTIATNTLLERRGARVAFITTEGFRDLATIARQNRPRLYDLRVRKPAALVAREDCFALRERVDAEGRVLVPLDEGQMREVLREIRGRGIESVAVCLLFSYLNPQHEAQIAKRAAAEGIEACCSSTLLPEFREFERATMTIANAYVAPRTARTIERLTAVARQAGAREVRVMLSNGGQAPPAVAAREAVRTILSGPAGGAVAAAAAARALGITQVLTYDMGGTSTDVALCDGQVEVTTETEIDGWPVRVPMLAIHTVGAGGGSIATVDAVGALRVGPESAGADPGPACYGRGEQATVTDANVVLGRIDPARFLGGRMRLEAERSHAALTALGQRLNCDATAAAQAVIAVANAGMERALHVVSAQRGYDPADFWLVSFGGAGGLHACALADALGLPGVIVPPDPGILSATGMILADVVRDFSVSLPLGGGGIDLRMLQRVFADLMDRAAEAILRDGFDLDEADCERLIDLRYVGQAYELTVPVESLTDAARLSAPFHRLHARRFGLADESLPVEAVTARVRATVLTPKFARPRLAPAPAGERPPVLCEREVAFERPCMTRVYERRELLHGHEIDGPALILEDHATTLSAPGWRARVGEYGHLVMERSGGAGLER